MEEEVRALRSLTILARMEICKANREKEEAKEAFRYVYSRLLCKKRKVLSLRKERTYLQDELLKSQEVVAHYHLEATLLEEERDNRQNHLACQ